MCSVLEQAAQQVCRQALSGAVSTDEAIRRLQELWLDSGIANESAARVVGGYGQELHDVAEAVSATMLDKIATDYDLAKGAEASFIGWCRMLSLPVARSKARDVRRRAQKLASIDQRFDPPAREDSPELVRYVADCVEERTTVRIGKDMMRGVALRIAYHLPSLHAPEGLQRNLLRCLIDDELEQAALDSFHAQRLGLPPQEEKVEALRRLWRGYDSETCDWMAEEFGSLLPDVVALLVREVLDPMPRPSSTKLRATVAQLRKQVHGRKSFAPTANKLLEAWADAHCSQAVHDAAKLVSAQWAAYAKVLDDAATEVGMSPELLELEVWRALHVSGGVFDPVKSLLEVSAA